MWIGYTLFIKEYKDRFKFKRCIQHSLMKKNGIILFHESNYQKYLSKWKLKVCPIYQIKMVNGNIVIVLYSKTSINKLIYFNIAYIM